MMIEVLVAVVREVRVQVTEAKYSRVNGMLESLA
jgi:hypothetical protein